MNNEKVYVEGYVVGFIADTTGIREKQIQVSSGEIVSIDESFIHKSITPEKVTIPQMVADWIDACKENLAMGLYTAMNPDFLKQWNKSDELISWIKKMSNQEIFARAWLDGYEIDKEKRYTVVMKTTKQPLYYNAVDKKLFFSMGGLATNFTQKQLEDADFGWVFDCPGIEIEEME